MARRSQDLRMLTVNHHSGKQKMGMQLFVFNTCAVALLIIQITFYTHALIILDP